MVARGYRRRRLAGRTAAELGRVLRRAPWMLLAALATHLALVDRSVWVGGSVSAADVFVSACVLALGGCLWFVAARQVSHAAALLALGLFVFSPEAWHPDRSAVTALAVFVLLMTAVGVGHALQGPPRKWPPRFVLLALCSAAAALMQPCLAWAALVAAAAAMLYLAERRRVWVAPILLGLAAIAGLAALFRPNWIATWPALFALQPLHLRLEQWAGILLALAAGLALWIASPRSRFFGHTAPLFAAALLAAMFRVCGTGAGADARACALAPALLFVAGVFADGFDSNHRRWWQALAFAACAAQAAVLILLTS